MRKWLKVLFCDHKMFQIGELYKDDKSEKIMKHMECSKCTFTEERPYF
jgi:hypothetical protein